MLLGALVDLGLPLDALQSELAKLRLEGWHLEARKVHRAGLHATKVDVLTDVLVSHLPEGPELYPGGELTDEPEAVMVAELVREAALEGVRDELPHSLAVQVEEIVPREGTGDEKTGRPPLLDVRVNLFVERDSQKAIVIGRGGSRLRDVGTRARRGIEALLGARVYLDLHVRVREDWRENDRVLHDLGLVPRADRDG